MSRQLRALARRILFLAGFGWLALGALAMFPDATALGRHANIIPAVALYTTAELLGIESTGLGPFAGGAHGAVYLLPAGFAVIYLLPAGVLLLLNWYRRTRSGT